MPQHNRLLCAAVILLLFGILWSYQVQAADPGIGVPAKTPLPPALNEKDLFPYKQKGRGTVAGQAFLASHSGKAITQAGTPVHLIPITPYTRYWFDHNVKTTSCSETEPSVSLDTAAASHPSNDCVQETMPRLYTDKRLPPYIRTTRANPTGHFWFTKIPAGRYYIVSLIKEGSGTSKDEQPAGLAWLTIELDAGEKLTNLVVTDCKTGLC